MQARNLRVPGVDDLDLNLVDWGGEGRPLLLLHGYGHGAHLWDHFIPDWISRYRVMALDSRGHGLSSRDPEFRYHNAAIARDVEAVCEHLALEDCVVVGHSQGGHAALRLAGRHPERVARLVLAETASDMVTRMEARGALRLLQPDYASEAAYAAIVGEVYPNFPAEAARSLAHHFLEVGEDGNFSPRLDARFLRARSKKEAEWRGGFDRKAWAKKEEGRFWHYLSKIECPTLILRGEHSPLLPAETLEEICSRRLRDGRAGVLAGAGHALMLDQPSAFREALAEFLLD